MCLIPYKFRSPSLIQIFARFLMLLFTKGRIPVLGLFYATSKCVFPNWRLQCYIHKYTFGLIVCSFYFMICMFIFLKVPKMLKVPVRILSLLHWTIITFTILEEGFWLKNAARVNEISVEVNKLFNQYRLTFYDDLDPALYSLPLS